MERGNHMNIIQITALLFILGTALTTLGFGLFPSRIYTSNNSQEKLNLLTSKPRQWVLSQSVVLLGSITSVVASIYLYLAFRETRGVLPLGIGLIGFVLGHVFWTWQLVLRIVHPEMMANNTLPAWLFRWYSILVLLGLAGFGIAFWLHGNYAVLGIGLFLVSLLVLGLFLKFKGMLPIVYYVMTLTIGIVLLF